MTAMLAFTDSQLRAVWAAANGDGHYCSRSMWRGYAYGEWYVRENARSPCHNEDMAIALSDVRFWG